MTSVMPMRGQNNDSALAAERCKLLENCRAGAKAHLYYCDIRSTTEQAAEKLGDAANITRLRGFVTGHGFSCAAKVRECE